MSETTTNTAQLRRANVWSSQLKDVLLDELAGQGYVNWLTDFPDGDQFNIPSIGQLGARDYTENAPVVYDPLATGNFTFSINQYKSSGIYITNKAKQDMYYMNQLIASFVPKEARAIAEVLETDIFALGGAGASGGQTGGALNSINGAAHRFVGSSAVTGGQALGIADFARARYSLKKANVPDAGLIALVDPSEEYIINTLTNLSNVSNNPMFEGIITSGIASGRKFVKNIYGFDVYTSNYLAKGQNETMETRSTTTGVANLFMSASSKDLLPFLGAWRQMPTVETEYKKDFQREEYVTVCRYGLKVFRPENLVVALSDTAVAV
jgi:hypothetical protein